MSGERPIPVSHFVADIDQSGQTTARAATSDDQKGPRQLTAALAATEPDLTSIRPAYPRAWHRMRALWLVATVVATIAPSSAMPATGLDPSWAAALNLAGAYHLRFGTDLVFTYGPLGFVDVPLATSPRLAIVAYLFQSAVVILFWIALRTAIPRDVGEKIGCALTSLATAVSIHTLPPSTALIAPAVYFATEFVRRDLEAPRALRIVPYALGGLAGIELLVKFSDGVATAAIAGITVAFGVRAQWLRRAAGTATCFICAALACWILSQHSYKGLGAWLGGSVQVALGYVDAMSKDHSGDGRVLIAAAILGAALIALTVRSTPPGVGRLGSIVLVVVAALYGVKAGFVRSDLEHRASFFVILIPLTVRLSWLLPQRFPLLRRWTPAYILAVLVMLAGPVTTPLNLPADARAWARGGRALVDTGYRAALTSTARTAARHVYHVPERMVREVGQSPVVIDPWEVTVAWAYTLHWHPAPVFQTYSAYTASLDRMEASFLRDARPDQYVLRQRQWMGTQPPASAALVRPSLLSAPAIDGRNPAWESPRYQLTLFCDYRVVDSSSDWLLFRKSANRCAPPTSLAKMRVAAGRPIAVPRPGPGRIVVMRFAPSNGVAARLQDVLYRPSTHLEASCDAVAFRLPGGLASGPVLVAGPTTRTADDPIPLPQCSYVAFNSSGSLTFYSVAVR